MCHVAPGSKQCWAVYSGDTAPALLTLGARVRLASAREDRMVPLSDFFVNDGLRKNIMRPDEILADIFIPAARRGYAGCYEKFRVRGSVDYPLAGVAVAARKTAAGIEDLRIGLSAVNPRPVLVEAGTAMSIDAICELARKTAKPLKTSASTMEYRRHMVGIMVKRALQKMGIA